MLPTLNYAEFYITNVCNLVCPQCDRFNHLDFKGRYDFDPEIYESWSKKVNLKRFSILGGEPTLHPGLGDWMRGVRRYWPEASGKLSTNGTYLSRCAGLKDLLIETNILLSISYHNVNMKKFIWEEIKKTFGRCEIDSIERSKDDSVVFLRSQAGVLIEITNSTYFHQNALVDGRFELYDSDPEQAHKLCAMSKCHHFIDGELYKCGVVKLAPLLFEQHGQPVPELLKQYRPLQVTDDITQEVLDNFGKNHIEQCKFCPDQLEFSKMQSRFKNKQLNIKVLGA